MTLPYCNNLQKDDVVQHAETKRPGKVAWQPRSTARFVGVVWQGTHTAQSVDIVKLRLVVNGVPEDVPPIDGEPPPLRKASEASVAVLTTGLDALKRERQNLTDEMEKLEARFKTAKVHRDRLDQAIKLLDPAADRAAASE